jgi:hypothetical protein
MRPVIYIKRGHGGKAMRGGRGGGRGGQGGQGGSRCAPQMVTDGIDDGTVTSSSGQTTTDDETD